MVSDRTVTVRHSSAVGLSTGVAILFVTVFALGAFIGYHSVYRNISVAMLSQPVTPSQL